MERSDWRVSLNTHKDHYVHSSPLTGSKIVIIYNECTNSPSKYNDENYMNWLQLLYLPVIIRSLPLCDFPIHTCSPFDVSSRSNHRMHVKIGHNNL